MKNNNATQDALREVNKKLMNIIISNQINQQNELNKVNELLKTLVSCRNNGLIVHESTEKYMSAQEVINTCEVLQC